MASHTDQKRGSSQTTFCTVKKKNLKIMNGAVMWLCCVEALISDSSVLALLSLPSLHYFLYIFFCLAINTYTPPFSRPHFSSLSHNTFLFQFLHPFCFSSSLPHSHPIPLCLCISIVQLMSPKSISQTFYPFHSKFSCLTSLTPSLTRLFSLLPHPIHPSPSSLHL